MNRGVSPPKKKNRPPWMAVENLLAQYFYLREGFSRIGRTPQKNVGGKPGRFWKIKKGGSTQSRPNLTNHHYKEPG
jgi:hypothetical protein